MSEPQADQRDPLQDKEACGISLPEALEGRATPPAAEAMDNTPTIISQPPARPARAEEAFSNSLRGRRLAHFELLEPIGVGGMAAVIRARDSQLDRLVALKILPPHMAADAENVRRFHQEARAAAKLDHENIARVFFCGEDQGLHFIAFEFVEGENLRNILAQRGRLPVAEAVQYVLQIASGLAHSAERGVVHRDIKPSNIIIGANGRAKLVDMGLARSLEPKEEQALTQSGVTLGTFDYISPEQALEPRDADARSDIYSLGCTFYHMLTGRPPVPEGTAAKKLHHHQHVAPTDPQELAPDIPREINLVVKRMMAKDPQDRYQHPGHVMQELTQLASMLGVNPRSADTVIYADVPRRRRRRRRFLLAAATVPVLIALLVFQAAPWPDWFSNRRGMPISNKSNPRSDISIGTPGEASSRISFKPATEAAQHQIGTARDLASVLDNAKDPHLQAEVRLTHDLDLTSEQLSAKDEHIPGLVFQSKDGKLTIAPAESSEKQAAAGSRETPQLRTIKLTYDSNLTDAGEGLPLWTALTIKGGTVVLRNIRFELDAREAREVMMAAIRLQEGAKLELENCEFIQINPPESTLGQLASVVIENAGGAEPKLTTIKNCYFGYEERTTTYGKGVDAIAVTTPAELQLENCAFGPHAAVIHLQAGRRAAKEQTEVSMSNCSAFLVNGSAFQVDEGAVCRLNVRDTIFSRPSRALSLGATATLIQQSGSDNGEITYADYDNRYHNIGAFWVQSSGTGEAVRLAPTWDKFAALQELAGKDTKSRVLVTNPWAEKGPLWADKDPLRFLKMVPPRPQEAFRVDVRTQETRQVDQPRSHLVGVEYCSWGLTVEDRLPEIDLPKPTEIAASTKIVDPSVTQSAAPVYPTLSQAIGEAKPEDVILIKHTGRLAIDPILLDKPDTNLTIKPYPDTHPVLTLGQTSQADTAMFHLHSGRLRLEKLEFLLHPASDQFTGQAVVDMVADGQCTLDECVVTFEELRPVHLALAVLTDPSGVMRMAEGQTPQSQAPLIHLERCYVRGDGDLVSVRASRPLRLAVNDSLVALGGSFLNVVDGNPKGVQASAQVVVELRHVTTYLAEHLIRLAARELPTLVPVQVRPQDCLFASAGGKPFVHLDVWDGGEAQMRSIISWEGTGHNVYSNAMPMFDPKPRADELPMPPFSQDRWKSFAREPDGQFKDIKFAGPMPPEAPLASLAPTTFRVSGESDPQAPGASIDQLPSASRNDAASPGRQGSTP
jgi:serine/threonine protein kinase